MFFINIVNPVDFRGSCRASIAVVLRLCRASVALGSRWLLYSRAERGRTTGPISRPFRKNILFISIPLIILFIIASPDPLSRFCRGYFALVARCFTGRFVFVTAPSIV
jgi:hypothetical protein